MDMAAASRHSVPRIEGLAVRNYRVLHDVRFSALTPLTTLLGPNGSGKSTLFDVFAFLSECFTLGLRRAWDRRNRFRELRTRGCDGPIVIEMKYREAPGQPLITYHLAIDEAPSGPIVAQEWLRWKRQSYGAPFYFLRFERGTGEVVSGELPDENEQRAHEALESPEFLAVATLGQFARHPRVSALRRFITGWYLSYLTADSTRETPQAGPQERLSKTGDNLPNVIQYPRERHPDTLQRIVDVLARRVPGLEGVHADLLADGRLLLQVKDSPFERPILAKFASDGTLKMLAYLTALYDPAPPPFIGLEEPENHLHPRLLVELAEECRNASGRSQLMVTTHSPFFVNGLKPDEVWIMYRNEKGFTEAKRASTIDLVAAMMNQGANLGHLWMEGYFSVGDPLVGGRTPSATGPLGTEADGAP